MSKVIKGLVILTVSVAAVLAISPMAGPIALVVMANVVKW